MNIEGIYRMVPTMETDRLILRKLAKQDAEDMFKYASEPAVSRFMPWELHKSIDDTEDFFSVHIESVRAEPKIDGGN